ncbi:MAG: ComEC/Rec2 family competence protein [Candidatus Cryptobacteroides sp.]
MDLKRRTVGLTLPFIFGDAAAITCGTKFYHSADGLAFSSVAVLAALSVTIAALVCSRRGSSQGTLLRVLLFLCIFLCGVFCGLTALVPSASPLSAIIPSASPLSALLQPGSPGSPLTGLTDAVGFRDSDSNALVRALLTGDRSLLSPEIKSAFRDSGASHILALSGFHLGIIYLVISKSLSPIGRTPAAVLTKSITICSATGLYALLTGGSPSIVRAFLFILLKETAGLCGRKPSGAGLLAAALTLQLTITPLAIKTVSFQLSYLAMAGIIFIFPAMKEWWPGRNGILKRIWESCALAISCQAFTAPAVWAYFGTFPTYFLLTNLIATPLVTLIMFLSLAATALSAAGACPEMLVSAYEKLVGILLFCLETISSL